jgi:DNA repair exonuclease SbcCD ATPase subunit
MINFGNLEIIGYCSIDRFEMNLSTNRVTVIRGRNGSGKTSLLSAILWVIYGSHSKEGVKQVNTWKKIQPKDYQGTMVSLFFEKMVGTTK